MTILGRSEELVSRCIECDLAEPESLASLGGSAPGVVDGILSNVTEERHGTVLLVVKRDMAENFAWAEVVQTATFCGKVI